MNRLTFASEKNALRMVVDNGVDASSPRVMVRTNEAIQQILGAHHPQTGEPVIPVNSMMIAEVNVVEDLFYLPPEMESAIHLEELDAKPDRQIIQGFYNIVNPFTYLDPSMAHDNPFVDQFLSTPFDATKFQRGYLYPGFGTGTIQVIGPKAYVPITNDADTLIVQNVPAIKLMIQSIEYRENNQGDEAKKYYDWSIQIIVDEIKKHQMDPRWMMKRKGEYERDLTIYAQGSMGWTRARVALEVPGAMQVGRVDIMRVIDRAQLRMMTMMAAKGTLEEFNAKVTDGNIYFPTRVESVLAASFDGCPVDIRSIFYKYVKSGGACGNWTCCCSGGRLEDEGEKFFPSSGTRRRVYRAFVGSEGSELVAVCKLRWEPKKADEQLTIRNFEANRIMSAAILLEDQNRWDEAMGADMTVKKILDKELKEYLAGVQQVFPRTSNGMSMRGLGRAL